MTQPAKSQEPSMEEILASIRRIIADDDASKRGPDVPKAAAQSAKPAASNPASTVPDPVDFVPNGPRNGAGGHSSDILELTDSMATPLPRTAPDMGFGEGPQSGRDIHSELLSRSTTAAVDSAFSTLAQSALAQSALGQNPRSLEDLVREMLRPLLKAWLDENLPGMVERLVRSEIERVSRGR
jgi:uncharacterized protein